MVVSTSQKRPDKSALAISAWHPLWLGHLILQYPFGLPYKITMVHSHILQIFGKKSTKPHQCFIGSEQGVPQGATFVESDLSSWRFVTA